MARLRLFFIAACALLTTDASAADAAEAQIAPGPDPHINCTCRAQGRSYHIGERVCLSTPKGYRVAECRMQQNVTNWAVSPEDCSVSAAVGPAAARS